MLYSFLFYIVIIIFYSKNNTKCSNLSYVCLHIQHNYKKIKCEQIHKISTYIYYTFL